MNLTVYLRRGCGFAQGLTSFLNALGVPHRTVNIDQDPAAKKSVAAIGGKREETPFVDFGDGKLLKMPTNQEVYERLQSEKAIPPA
ncbi:MAG: glutaredoxin domain-containing protein [Bdellovibrionia bacterium]